MSIDIIKTIIHEFNDSNLTKLKLNYEDFEIELERSQEINTTQIVTPGAQAVTTQIVPVATTEVNVQTSVVQEGKKHIKSPMVGTFYAASTPDSKAFVSVGDHVKKGDIVCIVEAMKLMNEVEAEVDGEVVEILANNGDMVEFDQPLFVIK